jgi:hypothetical protein
VRTGRIVLITLATVVGLAALAWWIVVPKVVEHGLRDRLDAAGFQDAAFEVGDVALDRIQLLDVTLAAGLALGDVAIHAGPWQLWRDQPADVVVHGARVDRRALAKVVADSPARSRRLPFRRVVIRDSRLDELSVRGTIDLRGEFAAFDLTAESPRVRVGAVVVENVAATVRGPSSRLRACATGTVRGAELDACAVIDARPATRRSTDLVWAANDPRRGWRATGKGALVREGNSLRLAGGTIDATMTAGTIGGLTVAGATLHAEVTGDLGAGTLTARGAIKAAELAADHVKIRDATLPFALTGDALGVRSTQELVLSATSATITAAHSSVRVDAPILVASGTAAAGGATFAFGGRPAPLRLVAKLRGIPVDRVLTSATRGRAHGTGTLDGELVLGVGADGLALIGGKLANRAPGRLRIPQLSDLGDVSATDIGPHRRIAAALGDFAYTQLALTVHDSPDLRLSLLGRGRRIPQSLDININVRFR